MIKQTLTTVGLLALASCGPKQQAEAPPSSSTETMPAEGGSVPAGGAASPAPEAKLPPATPDERAKWFQTCWALFNAKDWNKFSGCYAENAKSERVDSGMPALSGRADIVEKGSKMFATAFPDGSGEHQLTLVNGNNIVSVVLMRGTNSGPMSGPMGTIPATNKKVGYLLAHVVETTDDGRAVQSDRLYSDGGTQLGQLGLNPGPHRKLIEVGWAEKPVVLATGGDAEKVNLAATQKGLELFNKHDVNGLIASSTDDIVFSDLSSPTDFVGKQAVKKSYQELFKGFSDVKLDVSRSWAAGDYVVLEGVFSGTNNGDMPSMKMKKTGKTVSVHFVEIDKLQGGKLKNAWIFNNGMAFASQLGLVPPPGSKDAKPAGKEAKPTAMGKDAKPAAPAAKDAKPAAPAAKDAKPAAAAGPAPGAPAAPAAKSPAPAAPPAAKPTAPASSAK